MAAKGHHVHGEADLVESLLGDTGGTRVLDAGCGTGRVAIELASRGFSVVGADVDGAMLTHARDKAPGLTWVEVDLTDIRRHVDGDFDLVVLAGNVMIFLDPGSEGSVVRELAGMLVPGGLLVAGFSLLPDRLAVGDYDRFAERAGLEPASRWATWAREPFVDGTYAVSVHSKPALPQGNQG